MTELTGTQKTEARSLNLSMAGNLFMGAAGVLAAYLSNSQAILVDGLFSLVGFTAALLGKHVARNANREADKFRPYGYAGDEAIFTTFRSLSLLGLVVFAIANAVMAIVEHARGMPMPALVFEPMAVYFVVVGLTCGLLWLVHRRAWVKTGRRSDVLRLEAGAAAFDGLLTMGAAAGLLLIHYFRDGFLAPVAPVGDSIIVMILCAGVVSHYFRDFLAGLAELAGVTATPENIAAARRAMRETLKSAQGELVDVSVTKLGRAFTVVVYFNPATAITAAEADLLTTRLMADVGTVLPAAEVYVMISEHGRDFYPVP